MTLTACAKCGRELTVEEWAAMAKVCRECRRSEKAGGAGSSEGSEH